MLRSEQQAMSVRELKEELKAGGVSTSGMVEMEDLNAAVESLRMKKSAASCSHCGKQGTALKRCLRCKRASYCGVDCQKAGWRLHKTTAKVVKTTFAEVAVDFCS